MSEYEIGNTYYVHATCSLHCGEWYVDIKEVYDLDGNLLEDYNEDEIVTNIIDIERERGSFYA